MYGIGSVYDSTDEKLEEFVRSGVACIGWPEQEAPGLHQQLAHIGVGDIMFVKAFPPAQGLYIKAVGIVSNAKVLELPRNLGFGREVKWVWSATNGKDPLKLGRIEDRYDFMRTGTMYLELGPLVQEKIIDILVNPGSY